MDDDVRHRLTGLIAAWRQQADDAYRALQEDSTMFGFYSGIAYGLETSRHDLAEVLAAIMREQVNAIPVHNARDPHLDAPGGL